MVAQKGLKTGVLMDLHLELLLETLQVQKNTMKQQKRKETNHRTKPEQRLQKQLNVTKND